MKRTRLSLCLITGNAENYFPRFIEKFKRVADEVVVVRAIGNQEPDGTLALAEAAGCITGEYFNRDWCAPETEGGVYLDTEYPDNPKYWPHVDDFAAARNAACALATGDWLMWADTDDDIDDDSTEQIRRLVQDIDSKPIDGVLMPYVVPEDGVINWRERLWRKGKAEWVHPIHECLQFHDAQAPQIKFEAAKITHASGPRSRSRDERNLRILESIPEETRTVSQKFHVFQTLIALDRNDEAIIRAIEFTKTEGVGKNELYEAFFQLARLADSEEAKRAMLLQALATDPGRREAYGELALALLPTDPQASLAWTEGMMALSLPENAPWNLRRTYYGHLGVSLRAMALRAVGRPEEAGALELNHFTRHGAKISLLHATRGRPGMAWQTRTNWLRLAADPDSVEHIFAIDQDDLSSFMLRTVRHVVTFGNGGPVDGWNTAARAASGQILVQLSDDWQPFYGWDKAIFDAITNEQVDDIKTPPHSIQRDPLKCPAVLAVSDGNRKDDLLCMAILTRARYKQQGYMFHPEFFSMFSDNWFSERAFADGVVIDARDRITFEHLHPAFGKGEMDETYARSNAEYHYKTGAGILRRLREGVKVSADIHGWFDFRDFYDYVAQKVGIGGIFVEVGSWKGKSAVYLAHRIEDLGNKEDVSIICVDTFLGDGDTGQAEVYDEFMENRENAEAGISVMRLTSCAAARSKFSVGCLDGVFLDAAHDYESVKADIAAWLPKVKPGGIFAGHDIDSPGVLQAVQEAGFEFATMGRVWVKTS